MALFEINNVAIKGIAAAVPDNEVNTNSFDFFNEEEAKVFIETVGIENRFMANENICASDLCYHAAEKLIFELGWEKESIDLLAFESVTRDYRTPPTSCILQDRLSLSTKCFTFDIPMGCCGFMYAITIVGNMMSAGFIKRALLLVGDTATRMSSPLDKSRVPLFGDCGTAIALEYDKSADKIISNFNTQGSGCEALKTPHSEFRHQVSLKSFEYEDFGNGIVRAPIHSLINGMDVFAFAISKPPKDIIELLEYCKLDKEKDIDFFLIHQANKMIIDRIVKKTKIDPLKVPQNLKNYGNCGGASIPLLMVTELKNELENRELSLILSSFGLGLTWGTMYLKTSQMHISELIKVPL